MQCWLAYLDLFQCLTLCGHAANFGGLCGSNNNKNNKKHKNKNKNRTGIGCTSVMFAAMFFSSACVCICSFVSGLKV